MIKWLYRKLIKKNPIKNESGLKNMISPINTPARNPAKTPAETPAKTQPKIPDVMLVPILAFDKNKNRLGYGKGFYDRYLNKYL